MVDLTVTGSRVEGDKLVITGTGFTKTTTTVTVDGEGTSFEWLSETEISLGNTEGGAIEVTKGETTLAVPRSGPGSTDNPQPATSTTADGEDALADASPEEVAHAASAGAQTKAGPRTAPDPKTAPHLPAEGFREAVVNQPAGDLNMDPREPYPTGNPPDPREAFHRMHGYYPKED